MIFSILGTVVHSYLYTTSYIANVLDVLRLRSLQKRRHLFRFTGKRRPVRLGRAIFLKHALLQSLVSHEESPLILFILLYFYCLFRQNWSFSTEETSAYRPVSWDAKWNNKNETTSTQDSKASHNLTVACFMKSLNWNIDCCCKVNFLNPKEIVSLW